MATKQKFLSYKGRPLVRCGNTIYYGNPSDKFVLVMQIVTSKKIDDLDVADRVIVQLVNTDTTLPLNEQIVKKSEKRGLYAAMDIGTIWLERALSQE
ncbi:MAG: hypothetical protein IJM97_07775 [Clostridia bacterium]|nr:hypothetical protein [Clostridia bacterium]MBQ6708828.1 hypothetical protein [Clostridia bacterium]